MISTITLLILFVGVVILYIVSKKYTVEKYKTEALVISKSQVDGMGVFTNQVINEGDVILGNIFNGNDPVLLGSQMFKLDKFMSMFNHCSSSDNSTIVKTGDEYYLIATKQIPIGAEITSNYDDINKEFSFIKSASPEFQKC
jgi:hypothetical protein